MYKWQELQYVTNFTNATTIYPKVTQVGSFWNVSYYFVQSQDQLDGLDSTDITPYSIENNEFLNNQHIYYSPLHSDIQAAVRMITSQDVHSYNSYFTDVANINFQEKTTTHTRSTIVIGQMNDPFFAGLVTEETAITYVLTNPENEANQDVWGDIWFKDINYTFGLGGSIWQGADEQLKWGHHVTLHEMGHSLGLKHTHDEGIFDTPIDSYLDNQKYSVMSYIQIDGESHYESSAFFTANDIEVTSLQLLDIVNIQEIYGRNYNTRSEDNIYKKGQGLSDTTQDFTYTLWDGAGEDTIDANGYNVAAQVDLRQGKFSSIGLRDGSAWAFDNNVTSYDVTINGFTANPNQPYDPFTFTNPFDQTDEGNVAIALYAVIENAIGTAYEDILIGNAWDNKLWGGDGRDFLYGDGVVYDYDIGFIDPNESTGFASDYSGNDRLYGEGGNDDLYGGEGDDYLDGGEDEDYLVGGAGDDVLLGGNHKDDLNGDGGEDRLFGGAFDDELRGGAGNDTLYGEDGADALYGHQGNDIIHGGAGFDNVYYTEDIGANTNLIISTENTQDHIGVKDTHNFFDDLYEVEYVRFGAADVEINSAHISNNANGYLTLDGQTIGILTSGAINIETEYYNSGATINNRNIESTWFNYGNVTGGIELNISSLNASVYSGTDYDIISVGSSASTYLLYGANTDSTYNFNSLNNDIDQIVTGTGDDQINIAHSVSGQIVYTGGNDTYVLTNNVLGNLSETTLDINTLNTQLSYSDIINYSYSVTNSVDVYSAEGNFLYTESIGDVTFTTTLGNIIIENVERQGSYGDSGYLYLSDGRINISTNVFSSQTAFGVFDRVGGAGNDVFDLTSTAFNYAFGGDGIDTITLGASGGTAHGQWGDDILNGGISNDYLYGGDGNDTITGNAGNDTIQADAGSDTVNAGEGDDTVNGGAGNDNIYTGNGIDTVYAGEGNDLVNIGQTSTTGAKTIYGESGNDVLYGGADDDTIRGGFGNDYIHGFAGVNTLYGDEGNDTIFNGADGGNIYGGEGDDTLEGASGVDILSGDGGDDLIKGHDGDDTIYGGTGNDQIFGGANNDMIFGGDGDDVIDTGDGVDTVHAGNGNDIINANNFATQGGKTLYGDAGNDELHGGISGDTMYGGTGNDRFYGYQYWNTYYGEEGDDVFYAGEAGDFIHGGDGNDTGYGYGITEVNGIVNYGAGSNNNISDEFYGGDGNDRFYGGGGNDYIYGGTTTQADFGDDYLDGGDGNDQIYGGNGYNKLFSGNGFDLIYGGSGIDEVNVGLGTEVTGTKYIYGYAGDDKLIGGADDDQIYGGDDSDFIVGGGDGDFLKGENGIDHIEGGTGNDAIYGGNETDYLYGGDDQDYLWGEFGDDFLYGENGNDHLYGGVGNDLLRGGDGVDYLEGNNDEDFLYGDAGIDTIFGGSGNDHLYGGAGEDTLNGGTGKDIFYIEDTANFDYITDFRFADVDAIDLTSVISSYDSSNHSIYDFISFNIQTANDSELFVDTQGTGANWVKVADIHSIDTTTLATIPDIIAAGHLIVE